MAGFSKHREPTPLADILDRVLKKNLAPDERLSRVREAWRAAAGPFAEHSAPTAIKDCVLFVTVSSASLVQELSFQKEELIEELNQALGARLVYGIRFKTGLLPAGK
ncbi:MAG: DUF721 domain-containing protein [Deltaproteobacteria bacterium]|nr:DUF721 domain-containing protein [Deltaproteobacteria bacterium]